MEQASPSPSALPVLPPQDSAPSRWSQLRSWDRQARDRGASPELGAALLGIATAGVALGWWIAAEPLGDAARVTRLIALPGLAALAWVVGVVGPFGNGDARGDTGTAHQSSRGAPDRRAPVVSLLGVRTRGALDHPVRTHSARPSLHVTHGPGLRSLPAGVVRAARSRRADRGHTGGSSRRHVGSSRAGSKGERVAITPFASSVGGHCAGRRPDGPVQLGHSGTVQHDAGRVPEPSPRRLDHAARGSLALRPGASCLAADQCAAVNICAVLGALDLATPLRLASMSTSSPTT